jgi:hypothetical protein
MGLCRKAFACRTMAKAALPDLSEGRNRLIFAFL